MLLNFVYINLLTEEYIKKENHFKWLFIFKFLNEFYFKNLYIENQEKTMIQQRLIDTKRTLEKLATETGKSMEDILKFLSQGNYQFGINKIDNDNHGEIQRSNTQRYNLNQDSQCRLSAEQKLSKTSEHEANEKFQELSIIDKSSELIEESILDLNRAITIISEDIVQQMVTKKIYKIRQSFRERILSILGLKQLAFYVSHESGRVQFQDFSSNFITEIMQSDTKCQLLENITNSTTQLHFVDLADNSDMISLFQISNIERNSYFGIVIKKTSKQNSENIAYCLMIKIEQKIVENIKEIMNSKLVTKIVQISQISTSQDSISRMYSYFYHRSKLYSKMMLDLLQILIINYDMRLKKNLCRYSNITREQYYSLSNIIKIIISKIDENLGNQQKIHLLRKLSSQFQEMLYKKIQEIRMYTKYIRNNDVIMLEFNRVGILQFISGNFDNCYLNDLSRIWEEGKPVLDSLFGKNQKFQNYVKKAMRGTVRSQRPLQIQNNIKAKITANGRKIQKIHIMIENKEEVSSLSNSKQDKTLKEKDQNGNKVSSDKNIKDIKMIQKQNPGILEEGWLNLFMKNVQDSLENKKDKGIMSKKNCTIFRSNQLKNQLKRQLSYVGPKDVYKCSMEDISIDNPNINLLLFNQNQLEQFAIKVLDSLDYFQRLPQERDKLLSFIRELHDNYEIHENPFHNFKHGVNVMHTAYLLSTMPANFNILTVKDIFVNVFSGLCHDVGHTGFTNAFQIASMSRKAMIYNDKSPLENFHASLTFELLRKQENNFLCHMDRDQFAKFRKAVIQNILYTDIKEHFPLLNSFNDLLKSGKILGRQDAPILSYMIIHSSDFAGSTKQFEICKEWSRRVNMQFSNQYKMQGEIGIPQTPFMKDLTNPIVLSKGECGFLKVIVYPLYQALDNFYVTEGIAHKLKKNVQQNMKCWQEMNKKETQKLKVLEQENSKTTSQ